MVEDSDCRIDSVAVAVAVVAVVVVVAVERLMENFAENR